MRGAASVYSARGLHQPLLRSNKMANHNTNKSADNQTAERSRYWLTEPLRLPPDEFRIDLHSTEFETPKQARAEDKMKADLLKG